MGSRGIPEKMLAWPLYGVGLENLGREGRPVELPVPRPGPGELLARVDAVGLCFSDLKIMRLGGNHPRLRGHDLATKPVLMGHEVALTLVAVGEDLASRFSPGQRFAVQPDVYYRGSGLAYGYRLPGGLAEYSLIGREIVEGDEGCYLVPVEPELAHAEAALTEPWGCVEASYSRRQRLGLAEGGKCIVRYAGGEVVPFDLTPPGSARPARVVVEPLPDALSEIVLPQLRRWEVPLDFRQPDDAETFDDAVVLAPRLGDLVEPLLRRLKSSGVLSLLGRDRLDRPVALDVGRIHYDRLNLVGDPTSLARAHRPEANRTELRAGGTALLLGAGGAIGRMHVERAVRMDGAPGHLVCTNTHDDRLEELERDFGGAARARGTRFSTFNPKGPRGAWGWVEEVAPGGFDDVVILASSPVAVEEAWHHLADGGWMSVFAGIPIGTEAKVDLSDVSRRGVRVVGTTGLSIADQRRVMERVREGRLAPHHAVAAVGGLAAVAEGMAAMASSRFPGKIVIYPQLRDYPLTSISELAQSLPDLSDLLDEGRFWSRAAERAFLSQAAL